MANHHPTNKPPGTPSINNIIGMASTHSHQTLTAVTTTTWANGHVDSRILRERSSQVRGGRGRNHTHPPATHPLTPPSAAHTHTAAPPRDTPHRARRAAAKFSKLATDPRPVSGSQPWDAVKPYWQHVF